jgi:hypothetical protein
VNRLALYQVFYVGEDHRLTQDIPEVPSAAALNLPGRRPTKCEQPGFRPPEEPMSNCSGRAAAILLAAASAILPASASATSRPDDKPWFTRMLVCNAEGVPIELYVPDDVVFSDDGMKAGQTVGGYYTLDLSDINKGKALEPVRITMSADKTFVTVNQYTRGLPPTRIPVGGGAVDFDQRFARNAKCGPFQHRDPN